MTGLQGSGADAVLPANAPPMQSYFVDLDDRFDDANARGRAGDVAIRRDCAPGGRGAPPVVAVVPPPGQPPGVPSATLTSPPPDEFWPGPGELLVEFWPDWPPPPPPVCPVGTHPEANGVQCCPPNMIPGVSGVCQSPCANGSMNPADMFACTRGFQPGSPPAGANPGACWNGTAPTKVPGPACAAVNSFTCNKCPKPPLKRCQSGFQEVSPGGPPGSTWPWGNVQCQPIGAVICLAGQQPNMEGVCQALCPAGQTAYPVNRCCVNGTHVNALGQCPGVIAPPQWYLDFLATGTGPCLLPDGNCSHYEYTIIGRQRFGRGALSVRITLPEGSVFPEARVTRGSKYCPPSAWSCSRTGNGFTCTAEDCGLEPGDEVVLRTEGRVVPELTQPPPTPIDKIACGVLEWQPVSGPGRTLIDQLRDVGRASPPPQAMIDGVGTDQFGRTSSRQACHTIRVLPRTPPAAPACPPNYVPTREGQCCLATQMTATGMCCPAGQWPDAQRQACVPATGRPPAVVVPPPVVTTCPPGLIRLRSGECCLRGQMTKRGACCPPGQRPDRRGLTCVPVASVLPQCTAGKVRVENRCVCPPGTIEKRGRCAPIGVTPQLCPPGSKRVGQRCVPDVTVCPAGTRRVGNRCVPIAIGCPPGQRRVGNRCVPVVRPVRPVRPSGSRLGPF